MPDATKLGQAGLKGWREKVADGVAPRVARKTPLAEDQARALVGALFFVLAVMYIAKATATLLREARSS